ncbi:GDSL-like Lipase/Acylhydrolase [Vibrio aerogenes CECT 7868]|uniref:GDSL-like Lipase/Acylhydrolase n=1 Tax=Vibrio aerogenes CECT 7868 TaxID=1216006 RepID=A0A1M6A2G0_9VIBR|nr:SGNH/GDSL hydrolase family protein [Vibrio aerogenes]SHI30509.1 GDSL-like Lipase/Acylhydrolase [Vibrio aerogenes CECT 7868]
MKTILCYGDSNVWGYIPGGGRYGWKTRWTGYLDGLLGEDYRVIEEGLNGRNTGIDDPLFEGRNGQSYLPVVLESHYAADYVVLMLGTNDLKARFNRTVEDIARSAGQLIQLIQSYYPQSCEVILLSPPPVQHSQDAEKNEAFAGAPDKCEALSASYRYLSEQYECSFIDAGKYCATSLSDGVHLDAENHRALAQAVFSQIMLCES